MASIPRLLLTFSNPEKQIRGTYGFSASELDSAGKRLFATESGLFVTEVAQGGAGQEAGLKAGDLILSIGQRPIASVEELADVLASTEEPGRDLQVLRNSKRLSLSVPSADGSNRTGSADSTLGIRILSASPTGETIVVGAGTPAYRSGLRTGDRLIQVGETRSRGFTTLRQALTRSGEHPVFVVYLRGASERAAVVER